MRIGKREEAIKKLTDLLESKQFQTGERLPTEPELVKMLGCCRNVVREAISALVNEGYLSQVHGKGTYVAAPKQIRKTIAVLIPSLYSVNSEHYTSSIFPPIITAIEAQAKLLNARIVLYTSDGNLEVERNNFEDIIDWHVDGAIVFLSGVKANIDCLEAMCKSNMPFVMIDRYVEQVDADYVATDNYTGTYNAIKAMSEMGLEEVYFVTPSSDESTSARHRMMGYADAVNNLGLACNIVFNHVDISKPFNEDCGGYMSLRKTIEGIKFPAAIFSVNAVMNTCICRVLEDLKIPRDQLVLGHYDPKPASMTTDLCYFEVLQPLANIGSTAMQLVMDRIAGNKERKNVFLQPELVVHNLSTFVGLSRNATNCSEHAPETIDA